jgi:hypothetical protein
MAERAPEQREDEALSTVPGDLGRITLFEALAEDLGPDAVGIDRSNHSTQRADFDDQ